MNDIDDATPQVMNHFDLAKPEFEAHAVNWLMETKGWTSAQALDHIDGRCPPWCDGIHCSCGRGAEPYSAVEDSHFVFAVRQDGSRSNLGNCPYSGWVASIRKTATCFGMNRVTYLDSPVYSTTPLPDHIARGV